MYNNPSVARRHLPYLYEQRRKNIPLVRNMFLCSYVLINYPYVCYADAIKLRPYVRALHVFCYAWDFLSDTYIIKKKVAPIKMRPLYLRGSTTYVENFTF